MQNVRWWDAAAAGVALVLSGILALDPPYGPDDVGAWASIAAMLVLYGLLGRRLVRRQRTPLDLVHAALLATVVGTAVAFDPFMSFLQAFAYPLVWVAAAGLRTAITSNALIAVGVGAGYYVATSGNLLLAVGVAAFSFIFSLALGLWFVRVAELGEERARLLAELEAVQDELAAMHRDAGVTSERERLAREIHDTLAQSLTGLVLLAQRAGREIGATDAAGTPPTGGATAPATAARTVTTPPAAETIALIEQTAREALGEARALVAANAPVRVESDLPEALTRLAERFTRETGVRVSADVGDIRLARDVEVVLLRCAQEGLANVRKHAHATSAVVRVVALDGVIELTVADDGVGVGSDGASERSGFGVSGMRERLALVGGRLSLEPGDGRGSVLRATVPAPTSEMNA